MISTIDEGPIGNRFKGLPADAAGLSLDELAAQHRSLFDGRFSWPAMTLRLSAVEHNAALMSRYVHSHNLHIAPHLKTSMSPRLAMIAEAAGIWGVTVANAHQARVFMAAGATSIFLANELLEERFAADISAWQDAPGRDFICYVDSLDGVDMLDRHAAAGLDVVVELGHPGGRAGVRNLADMERIAQAVQQSQRLRLRGVAGYEGSVAHGRDDESLAAVRSFLNVFAAAIRRIAPLCIAGRPQIVSAGGSLYFDCVAEVLSPDRFPDLDVQTIIRSGAYLTHDSEFYSVRSPLDGDLVADIDERLIAGIRVWGQVLSRPEPSLLIVGAGRRDVNSDCGLPMPDVLVRQEASAAGASRPGPAMRDVSDWRVVELNDQHAFIEVPAHDPARPGELVSLKASHPCTLHQRWAAPLLIDDDNRVVDIARSYF